MKDEEMEDRFFKSMGTDRETIERQARVIARPYVEEEREACARIADGLSRDMSGRVVDNAAAQIAELIRRRT